MAILDEILSKARLIHYTTNLPVWVFSKKQPLFKIPKDLTSAELIAKNSFTIPAISENMLGYQVVQSDYKENAIILNIPNEPYTIAIGPFLVEQVEAGAITNMIRKGLIPFHQKTIIQNYYKAVPLITEDKVYYTGKLVNTLMLNDKIQMNLQDQRLDNSKLEDSYNQQKSEYRKNIFLHSPYKIEQEISKAISDGNTKIATDLLKEINLEPHAKLAPTFLRSYKNSMICSCAFMTRAAIAGGVNSNDAFTLSDTYINYIEETKSIEELETFESKMVVGFSDKVKKVKEESYSSTILNVIYYIDDHLCEDISTEVLAKQAYLNPSYLSSLFHKETGKTISEWILNKRIKEAAYFILNSKESFSDIAFFYHFSSQSYFVQCFKKIIGITPGEYRKQNKQQTN